LQTKWEPQFVVCVDAVNSLDGEANTADKNTGTSLDVRNYVSVKVITDRVKNIDVTSSERETKF
jgi:propanediol dehydratase small subunit